MTASELQNRNAQLQARCVSLAHDLERVCEERDAARKELESRVGLSEALRNALENWYRHPESAAGHTTDVIQVRCKVLVAYRAARDGGAV